MPSELHRKIFRALWTNVRHWHADGYCVSERGLQAELYCALSRRLAPARVVVEPSWTVGGKNMVPDLVTIEESRITNIFELKYVPHGFADLRPDLRKLLAYGAKVDESFRVRLDPATGAWSESKAVSEKCELHFVAVANYRAAAVWSESLKEEVPELQTSKFTMNHWFGRISAPADTTEAWGIEFGI